MTSFASKKRQANKEQQDSDTVISSAEQKLFEKRELIVSNFRRHSKIKKPIPLVLVNLIHLHAKRAVKMGLYDQNYGSKTSTSKHDEIEYKNIENAFSQDLDKFQYFFPGIFFLLFLGYIFYFLYLE